MINFSENGEIEATPTKDAMAFDTEEDLKKKKEKWMDIFQRCPDLSDLIIDLFDSKGEDGINELYRFVVQTIKIF